MVLETSQGSSAQILEASNQETFAAEAFWRQLGTWQTDRRKRLSPLQLPERTREILSSILGTHFLSVLLFPFPETKLAIKSMVALETRNPELQKVRKDVLGVQGRKNLVMIQRRLQEVQA